MRRRIRGRCYFCGEPCVTYWFCLEHIWAQGLVPDPANGVDYLTTEHRWWITRFKREEIRDLGGGLLERPAVRSLR